MMDNASATQQISLDRVMERSALVTPVSWQPLMTIHDLGNGLAVSGLDGKPDTDWEFQITGSPSLCLSILLEGRMQCGFQNRQVLDIEPGMVILSSLQQETQGFNLLRGKSRFRAVNISISPQSFFELTGQTSLPGQGQLVRHCNLPELGAVMGCLPASLALQQVADDMLTSNFPHGSLHQLYLRAKSLEALTLVIRKLISRDQPSLPVPGDRRRLLESRALLQEHYGHDWTIPALARAVALNEKRLQSGFQALFGQSIHTFLTQVRMDTAARLLKEGTSVTEVAYEVGFSSLSHFSKVFARYKGQTPKRWARNHAE